MSGRFSNSTTPGATKDERKSRQLLAAAREMLGGRSIDVGLKPSAKPGDEQFSQRRSDLHTRTPWQIQKAVIYALLLREIKARLGRHRLGAVMVLAEPVLHMVVMILIRGYLRNRAEHIAEFPVMLMIGLMPFILFKNIALRTMEGVKGEKSLLAYRQIRPMDMLVARTCVYVLFSLFTYIVILSGLELLGFSAIPRDPLIVIGLLFTVIPLGLGLGLILNVIQNIFPEAKMLIKISFMPLYFLSGVLHPLYIVPADIAAWLLWNPMLRVIELSRGHFLSN